MRKRLQGMVFGFVLAVLMMAGTLTVFAAVRTETLTATFRDIRLMVNNVLVTPTDVNGNVVEPFMISGTVYLPVRAVAESLGMAVDWDSQTSTVYIHSNVPLVGIWYAWGAQEYVFNADGTGTRWGDSAIIWEAVDGVLRYCTTPHSCLTVDGCTWPREFRYTVTGNRMHLVGINNTWSTMDLIQVTHSLTPVVTPPPPVVTPDPLPDVPAIQPEYLVGIWRFAVGDYDIFNADGTGMVMSSRVLWGVIDNVFLLCYCLCPSINECEYREEWIYEVVGDRVYLTMRHNTSRVDVFTFVDYMSTPEAPTPGTPNMQYPPEFPAELVGIWQFWPYEYMIFNADGTGLSWDWEILWGTNGNHLFLCFEPNWCESIELCDCFGGLLYFDVVGDELHIDFHYGMELAFIATRVAYMTVPTPPAPMAITPALVGTWYMRGHGTYIFNADGTGTTNGMNINWGTSDGWLYICTTPNSCQTIEACWAPRRWNYQIVGDQLLFVDRIFTRQ